MSKRNQETPARRLVVAGDVLLDWKLARVRRTERRRLTWNSEDRVRASWHWGSASLLADLIRRVLREAIASGDLEVSWPDLEAQHVDQSTMGLPHSYTLWQSSAAGGAKEEVWRIHEFLGMHLPGDGGRCAGSAYMRLTSDPTHADLVVIDDAALGFRSCPELWPAAIRDGGTCGTIVLKTARPVAQGKLWDHLLDDHADRLIVVIDVNDLRGSEVQISRGLSWEQSAQDIYWELTRNAQVNALSRCPHVVVTFARAGAMILSRDTGTAQQDPELGPWTGRLYFDRKVREGTSAEPDPGRVLGYTTCLTTALAKQIALCDTAPTAACIERGVQAGIASMRALYDAGCRNLGEKSDPDLESFPYETVVPLLAGDGTEDTDLSWVTVQAPFGTSHAQRMGPRDDRTRWSILGERCSGQEADPLGVVRTVQSLSRLIVRYGWEEALHGVPLGQFGALLTVDRNEIEELSSLCVLLDSYCRDPLENPLSIAVFGPPGSGKSFAVKQVAAHIDVGDQTDECTFNLSQLSDPGQLVDALHQVRDIGLKGKIPLVFWDEFDTPLGGQELGWLRYFLAPMQDGAFQDKQITHHIGHAIFVFAGGTAASMAEFNRGSGDHGFAQAKGPDFVSRLGGFLNVMGPNPTDPADPDSDPHYMVRRAVLLRSLLSRTVPHLFSDGNGTGELLIDSGVLRGFLNIPFYRHGVRSMQSTIGMSWLNDRNAFERSCLPSAALLDLHVDGASFLDLVQQPDLEDESIEPMARALHVLHNTGILPTRADGEQDERRYAQLWQLASGQDKEQSRDSIRDIFRKLASAGYVMVRQSGDEIYQLEENSLGFQWMAYTEHERWRREKRTDGWQWGEERDNQRRLNPHMLPWRKLDAGARKSTEDLVRAIPGILHTAGYTIRLMESAPSPELLAFESERQRVNVGVVGHRLLGEAAPLLAAVEEALTQIAEAYPGRTLRILSTLSEGASRLVAHSCLRQPGAELVVVLPLPEPEFRRDFTSPESGAEFDFLLARAQSQVPPPEAPSRSEAYAAADNYIVDEAEVLIAHWDGREAKGPGGTAQSVQRARAQGIPLLRIVVSPGDAPQPNGHRHGDLLPENWPPETQ